jgi:predicted GIY-YIG superfamily endonuclease
MQPFFVYMLRCSNGSFYVGHTDDLEKRMAEHDAGVGCDHTRRLRPVTLLYVCEFPTREEALASERQLKGWSRAKKQALVEGDWDRIVALARRRSVTRYMPFDSGRASRVLAQGERA